MLRRSGALLLVSMVAVCALAAAGGEAGSLPAVSGTWTMTSDPGESIGQGQSFSFSAPNDGIELGSGIGSHGVAVLARPAGTSDLWQGRFSAPAGARLVPGVYSDARRFEDATHPGLDVSGAGRGCNATTGQFTVLDASYGPYGYLNSLHLTFEQHCEGFTAALRGEINLVGAPAPSPLEVHLTVANTSGFDRADGSIQLQGTIACSQPAQAAINGQVSEETKKGQAFAYLDFFTQDCSPTPSRWKVKVVSATESRFVAGTLQTTLTASAIDDYYTRYNGYDPFIYATDAISTSISAKPGG